MNRAQKTNTKLERADEQTAPVTARGADQDRSDKPVTWPAHQPEDPSVEPELSIGFISTEPAV